MKLREEGNNKNVEGLSNLEKTGSIVTRVNAGWGQRGMAAHTEPELPESLQRQGDQMPPQLEAASQPNQKLSPSALN